MLPVGSEPLMTSVSLDIMSQIDKTMADCMPTKSVTITCLKPPTPAIKLLGGVCEGIHPAFRTHSRNLKSSLHFKLHDFKLHDVKVCEKGKVEKYRSIDDEWET